MIPRACPERDSKPHRPATVPGQETWLFLNYLGMEVRSGWLSFKLYFPSLLPRALVFCEEHRTKLHLFPSALVTHCAYNDFKCYSTAKPITIIFYLVMSRYYQPVALKGLSISLNVMKIILFQNGVCTSIKLKFAE